MTAHGAKAFLNLGGVAGEDRPSGRSIWAKVRGQCGRNLNCAVLGVKIEAAVRQSTDGENVKSCPGKSLRATAETLPISALKHSDEAANRAAVTRD